MLTPKKVMMKSLKNLMIVVFLMLSGSMFAQDIIGTWTGTLSTPQVELRVNFNVSKTDNGFSSTLDSPDQGAMGIPVDTTKYMAPEIKFVINNLQAKYEGKLNEDNIFEGTFTQMGQALELALTKKEE